MQLRVVKYTTKWVKMPKPKTKNSLLHNNKLQKMKEWMKNERLASGIQKHLWWLTTTDLQTIFQQLRELRRENRSDFRS